MSNPTVTCRGCGRIANCMVMSDGTVYRPFTWEYPDLTDPSVGECPACGDGNGTGIPPAVVTIPIAVSPSTQPATPTYINPLAALRRERKVKPGKAAKLLGISRQRLHVVEHATKPLRCMDRLLAKAAVVWPVVDETTKATPTTPHKESR